MKYLYSFNESNEQITYKVDTTIGFHPYYYFYKSNNKIGQCRLDKKYDDRNEMWIMGFEVEERFRGLGYASLLITTIENIIKEEYPGCDYIMLNVHKDSPVAIRVYEKAGFKIYNMEGNQSNYLYYQKKVR